MLKFDRTRELVCPSCKTALEQSKRNLFCQSCNKVFPTITDNIIPLFPSPAEAIASAYASLHRTTSTIQSAIDKITATLHTSARKHQLLPIIKGHYDNQDFFNNWMQLISPFVQPEELLALKKNSSQQGYGCNFNYLARDWSSTGTPETDQQVSNIKSTLGKEELKGKACFLGVGTGRFATELGESFDSIWGIDKSFGQLAQFLTVVEKPLDFWQINTRNKVRREDLVKKSTATISPQQKKTSLRINYAWADINSSPFENQSFDWIFSIYFSDVIPLPDLISEVKRVLKPGGMFLHYGPLDYHFSEVDYHYSYEEFKSLFVESGFTVITDSSFKPHCNFDNSLKLRSQYIDKLLLLAY